MISNDRSQRAFLTTCEHAVPYLLERKRNLPLIVESSCRSKIMSEEYFRKISEELKVQSNRIRATIQLLDSGATVPFIARYRKEATGSLDEVTITAIRDRLNQLRELDKRRATVLDSIVS